MTREKHPKKGMLMSIDRDRTSLKDVLRASEKVQHQEVSLSALEAAARLRSLALTVAHRVDAAFQASQGAFTNPALLNLARFQRERAAPAGASLPGPWANKNAAIAPVTSSGAQPGPETQTAAAHTRTPWSVLNSAQASAVHSTTRLAQSIRPQPGSARSVPSTRNSQTGNSSPAFRPALQEGVLT